MATTTAPPTGPSRPTGLSRSEVIQFSVISAIAILAIVLEFVVHADPTLLFIVSGVAVGGMAHVLGVATEQAGEAAGPRISALLNATFGNAAEMIIVVLAINQGLIDVARFSIIGSVLGNVLLILGASLLVAGFRFGRQSFDRGANGMNATMLVLATVFLGMPTLFAQVEGHTGQDETRVSLGVAALMLFLYLAYLYASFQEPEDGRADVGPTASAGHTEDVSHGYGHGPRWSIALALGMLAFSAIATGVLSEILVSAIEPTIEETGINEIFVGLIVVPLVGNIAEHLAAVRIAYNGNLDFAMGIAFNSALQVALAVSAGAVFAGHLLGNELTLVFTFLEIALLAAATVLAGFIAISGRSNWLEGMQLLTIYAVAALVFWFV